jgi:hypothetical protein
MKRFRALRLKMVSDSPGLKPGECPFSTNLVTGYSLNFPIADTCSPSKLCGDTCYAGCGPITWSASISKQYRNMISCKNDPEGFALRVLARYKKLRLDFITWNGSGDLFQESVDCVNWIGKNAPGVPQWVRTRKPSMAGQILEYPNVFVHFSLDKYSLDRKDQVAWKTKNHHYSYQYSPGETENYPEGVKVVFGHNYKLPVEISGTKGVIKEEVCPLNLTDDMSGTCISCRRCFSKGK